MRRFIFLGLLPCRFEPLLAGCPRLLPLLVVTDLPLAASKVFWPVGGSAHNNMLQGKTQSCQLIDCCNVYKQAIHLTTMISNFTGAGTQSVTCCAIVWHFHALFTVHEMLKQCRCSI